MYIPHQSLVAWKVVITVLHLIAISLTSLRLWFRYRRHRLWMDDYTAIPPLVFNIINAILVWMIYVETGKDSKLKSKVALYWLTSITWYTIIWFTRMSLTLSITRIFPDWGTFRRCARGVAVALATMYIGIMAWLFTTTCNAFDENTPLSAIDFLGCNSERSGLTLTGLVADISTCAFLFVAPIVILVAFPLSRGQHTLLVTLFGAGALVLGFSILLCVFQYSPTISGPGRGVVIGMATQLEAGLSIIGCNLLVVVTYLYGIDDSIEWKKKLPVPGMESVKIVRLAPVQSIDNRKQSLSDWSAHQPFQKM